MLRSKGDWDEEPEVSVCCREMKDGCSGESFDA